MHKLLVRQLKRNQKDELFISENDALLNSISDAYTQHDQSVKMLERSLYLISNELNDRNQTLKDQLAMMKQVQDKLEHSIGLLNATVNSTGEILFVYGLNGELMSFNTMGQDFIDELGFTLESHWEDFLGIIKDKNHMLSIIDNLNQDPFQYLSGTIELLDKRFFDFRSLPQIQDDQIYGRVWCFRDVTTQKQYEATIEYHAFHDSLTGLPNRALLLDRISHSIATSKREHKKLAVLFLDLDDFKKINDTEGHDAGDLLLKEVVRRLQTRLREFDTLSRQGGDEFIIVLEQIESEMTIKQVCQDLLALIKQPFTIGSRQFVVTSSIGISLFPNDDDNANALIRKADLAMYESKSLGKNSFHFYSQALEKEALTQLAIEQELRKAIEDNALHLVYQPKVDLRTMKIVSVEALCRWTQQDGTVVPPDVFITIAEQTGLIIDIGCVVISKACLQLAKWRDAGITELAISINLSCIEFQNEALIAHLIDCLNHHQLEGKYLIIELTESIFMEDKFNVKDIMLRLNQYGITFALDDFGKGYSSFSYLQFLPLHYLKIDKAFLQYVESSSSSAAIAKTIIDIGHNLGLKVIAEGVEGQFMLDYIKTYKCDLAQGFYLYKPMLPDAIASIYLANHASVDA
ncbi:MULTISPECIES: EAL domain-containing protein [Shewanella]|jgi:diguanylate cyclase (GGDEF)-like protein|uniref:putative bifunctional diguanylate cyclase/phosphodiesterase n=1 Tax=Shewanella TaxID=22 RepID=UPI000C44AE5E|nr:MULTISPECIES: EAL domain-containing protein [Shewanella]NCQ44515.1 EAL domain-containing protein [Shewanella frigidimarina]NCO72178.1 EAL domain-containing protein [Shewanella vesiculosa]NCP35858.1 EAL domain-containing protein [Shewanella vesiculosa]NCP68755.1 EAL domain-containing protein [Shewanella vesiculosa]NCP73522.1 EAL domain-containing protein [Shewanella vesiculosa]